MPSDLPLFNSGPHLAPYACTPATSKGRRLREDESLTRSCYQRDRDRIIHSGAFRKLMHKTQVFIMAQSDYYRTRLSHSVEVAQIARSIARALGVDEDLTECIALSHDFGHTPFGHTGEDELNEVMGKYGGFDHNAHTLRILTQIERRYAEFDGLNLTWETVEGAVKHNGPLMPLKPGKALPWAIAEFNAQWDLRLDTYASVEAQIAAISDDIAYNAADMEDGLRAGLLEIDKLADLPVIGEAIHDVRSRYPEVEHKRLIHETKRRLIDAMVSDAITEAKARLIDLHPEHPDEVRAAPNAMVEHSAEMHAKRKTIKDYLMDEMYTHYSLFYRKHQAERVIYDLFHTFMAEPRCLPTKWQNYIRQYGEAEPELWRARMISDYIAGMTDRYAMLEHKKLFGYYEGI